MDIQSGTTFKWNGKIQMLRLRLWLHVKLNGIFLLVTIRLRKYIFWKYSIIATVSLRSNQFKYQTNSFHSNFIMITGNNAFNILLFFIGFQTTHCIVLGIESISRKKGELEIHCNASLSHSWHIHDQLNVETGSVQCPCTGQQQPEWQFIH